MPEIVVEPVGGGEVQKLMDFVQHLLGQDFGVKVPLVKAAADVREPEQDAVLPEIPIDDEFRSQLIHGGFLRNKKNCNYYRTTL